MQILVKGSQIKACLQELNQVKPLNLKNIQAIIDKYHPIKPNELEPLKIFHLPGSLNKINKSNNLQQQFYEQKFVPSPDLMASYQQSYIKSLRGQQPTNLANNMLKQLYVTSNDQKFNRKQNQYGLKSNTSQVPVSNAYLSMTNQYNHIPCQAQNKRIFIQQRQQNILNQLNAKQKSILQMSIPVIQKSLMEYQIRGLQSKNIVIQNLGKLDKWKSKRQEIQNKFNPKK